MKISGLKYKVLLSIITSVLLIIDVFLMIFYGFEGQLLIFLYIIIYVDEKIKEYFLKFLLFLPTFLSCSDPYFPF